MIIESLILATIIIFFMKNKNLNNLKTFEFKNIISVFLGIILLFLINLLTENDFGKATDFIIKYYKYFHVISLLLITSSLLCNYKNFGFIISSVGILLNTMPVILNGKMPVSVDALYKTENERVIYILINNRSLSHGIFESPKLYILSDIIPFYKIIGYSTVISIGDIIISIGLILALIIIVKDRGAK